MVRGIDGMWYRAARYDTEEEARAFLGRLTPALRAHAEGENLLTLSFGTPEQNSYAVAMGFPTPEVEAFADSLFEAPPAILSPKDIAYAREQISNLRREAGMSDQEAALKAHSRLKQLGAPEDFAQEIAQAYTKDGAGARPGEPFRAELASTSPALPGLQPGTPLKMQTIPFLIGYQQISEMQRRRELEESAIDATMYTHGGVTDIATALAQVERLKLKRADKYQFTPSAITLLDAVHNKQAIDWVPVARHTWIEIQRPYNWQGENIKALYVSNAYPMDELKAVLQVQAGPLYEAVTGGYRANDELWALAIITDRCKELFDFSYDRKRHTWVFTASHICPYGACTYPRLESETDLGECNPCQQCRVALGYWASWLHTALRIIHREYALAPEEPAPYDLTSEQYSEQTTVIVGKGKNKRHIKREATRTIDYKLVTFEVSEISPRARANAQEVIEQEERHAQEREQKRPSWVTLVDPGKIVWEYREIDTSRGRTLDPERNARWKEYKHLEIAPFKKWVPMLARERKTIKRVTARRYEEKQ